MSVIMRVRQTVFFTTVALSKLSSRAYSFSFKPPPSPSRRTVVARTEKSQYTFGIIADVQWADEDDGYNYAKTVVRRYRGALTTLSNAVDWWLDLEEAPLYIAQLGDLLDGKNHETNTSHSALASALSHLNRAPCPTVNLIGNHELYNFNRPYLSKAPWLRHGDTEYYSFSPAPGWRTIVLDPYQIALIGHVANDPRRNEAVDTIQTMNPNVDPNGIDGDWFVGMEDAGALKRFVPYNGGLGTEQLEWLRRDLASAVEEGEKVVIMSHVILHPMACGGYTMVWDYEEALEVIASDEAGNCVVAVLAGHDHKGGYHCDEYGVHHCTFASPLNKGEDGFAFGLVHIGSNDCIEIRGPKIDDLLPCKNGRPSSNTMMVGDSISGPCEFIRLPLREGTPNRDGWLRTVL